MYIKKIRKNGAVHIPVQFTRQLPSNEVEVRMIEVDGKQCVLLVPVGKNKQVVTYYK